MRSFASREATTDDGGRDDGKLAHGLAGRVRPGAVPEGAGSPPRRPGGRRPAADPGIDDDPAAAHVRAGLAGGGRLRAWLLRLAGGPAPDGRRGRGVLRPLLLRGGYSPRRGRRLPVVPELVRRHAPRRD